MRLPALAMMLMAALGMQTIGFLWIKQVVKIEV